MEEIAYFLRQMEFQVEALDYSAIAAYNATII